jgi:hypothetical protein
VGLGQARDPVAGGGEQDAVAGLAGADGQPGGQDASMTVKPLG